MDKAVPRLLRLLSILQSQRYWTGPQLAEALDITQRTLRRDIDRLRSLGYPVQSTPGVAGGYQLSAGAKLPPLQLDDEEALAVSIALRSAARSSMANMGEAAIRALVKLERVLPARLQERAVALRTAITPLSREAVKIDAELLSTLAQACSDRKQLTFQYHARASGSLFRTVEPVGLVDAGYRWYLVAWDLIRKDWRTFRVDRIEGSAAPGQRFTPRPPPADGNLAHYVSESVSIKVYPHQVSVTLHAPINMALERIPPSVGVLEPLGPTCCRLTTAAPSLNSLVVWISLIGVEFDVEDHPEFVEHLQTLHARIGRSLERYRNHAP